MGGMSSMGGTSGMGGMGGMSGMGGMGGGPVMGGSGSSTTSPQMMQELQRMGCVHVTPEVAAARHPAPFSGNFHADPVPGGPVFPVTAGMRPETTGWLCPSQGSGSSDTMQASGSGQAGMPHFDPGTCGAHMWGRQQHGGA